MTTKKHVSRAAYSKRRTPAQRLMLKREMVDLLGGKCVDCGYSAHLAALDFDHKVPAEKTGSLAKMLNEASYEVLKKEVLKCELRCANCHRIKTHPQAHWDGNLFTYKGDFDGTFRQQPREEFRANRT